jgi:hypothetical protein
MIIIRLFADASGMYPTANARKSKLLAYCVYRKPYPGLLSEESAKLVR